MMSDEIVISENKLIYQVQCHQDEASFELLYRRYQPMIRKLWHQYSRHYISLEDWEQEAAVKLYQCLKRYDAQHAHFAHYYKTMLQNRLRDFGRHKKRSKRQPGNRVVSLDEDERVQLVEDDKIGAERVAECRQALNQMVQQCSSLEWACFLKLSLGYQMEEVAAELGISVGSVRAAYYRARTKYRRFLETMPD